MGTGGRWVEVESGDGVGLFEGVRDEHWKGKINGWGC